MGPEAEHSLKQIALEYTPSDPSLGKYWASPQKMKSCTFQVRGGPTDLILNFK